MTDEEDVATESLYQILEELPSSLPSTLDFSSDSPEMMLQVVQALSIVAICHNMLILHEFGGRQGPPPSNAAAEQVVAAAFQTFEGFDPHPHPFEKAAMLLRGIIQGHAFGDANKRTAFIVAMYYLEQVGYPAPKRLPPHEIVAFSLDVSTGRISDVGEIAGRLARFWKQQYP